VSHHRQQRRLKPAQNHPYPAPTKNYPNASLNNPPKQSTVNLPVTTSLKNLTRALPVTTSLKIPTIVLPVRKNQKNPKHSTVEITTYHDLMNPDYSTVKDGSQSHSTFQSFFKTTFLTLIYNTLTITPSMGTCNYEQDIIFILSCFITNQSEKQQAA
jgi:hypothetical protein